MNFVIRAIEAPKPALDCVAEGASVVLNSLVISYDKTKDLYSPYSVILVKNNEIYQFQEGDQIELDLYYKGLRLLGRFVYNEGWKPFTQETTLSIKYKGFPLDPVKLIVKCDKDFIFNLVWC